MFAFRPPNLWMRRFYACSQTQPTLRQPVQPKFSRMVSRHRATPSSRHGHQSKRDDPHWLRKRENGRRHCPQPLKGKRFLKRPGVAGRNKSRDSKARIAQLWPRHESDRPHRIRNGSDSDFARFDASVRCQPDFVARTAAIDSGIARIRQAGALAFRDRGLDK